LSDDETFILFAVWIGGWYLFGAVGFFLAPILLVAAWSVWMIAPGVANWVRRRRARGLGRPR
jgi:predicted PurR-regulated permease PerM